MQEGKRTASGVFVADDFRANLIVDRYNVSFLGMRRSKTDAMRSENSEDTLTWNVFRSLAQVNPTAWLPRLFERTFGVESDGSPLVGIRLWQRVTPPPALRVLQQDEGESEVDVLIENEHFVWFIEAKYKSDVSERTTNNPERDQVLRNIDVGSWYAGAKDFYFSLLLVDADTSPVGARCVQQYAESLDELRRRLPHRRDQLSNLKGISLLRWADLSDVLSECAVTALNEDERGVASRAVDWLRTKNIAC